MQMKVIVDANELFSAVIAKGKGFKSKTLDIFFADEVKLSAPYRLLAELENNREEIRSKSGFSHEDFDVFIGILKLRIDVVPLEDFLDKMHEAKEISPDPKDMEYFGLALKFKSACIWSEEELLKEQDKIKVLNTDKLSELLESKKKFESDNKSDSDDDAK